ncbi:hypothetical protein AWB74_01795 [Caballeronia arvi]|uniref:Uncharacterized protein n=1 Tax=Caballeronia arvi TaxID=1777135 RepID=A0A158HFX8_9BURK|nr:hypothetical protein AWB74_01795 [Caballeronia arvi]
MLHARLARAVNQTSIIDIFADAQSADNRVSPVFAYS